jgi:ABC-type nickel/cobalt efflux system permease component RcnA
MRGAVAFSSLALFTALMVPGTSVAHPVPRSFHDRTIRVQLAAEHNRRVIVTASYVLEVDEDTAVFEDLPAVQDRIDLAEFRNQPGKYYQAFTRAFGPVLAANLDARIDGKALTFRFKSGKYFLKDERQQPLGHLRCEYEFEAGAAVHGRGRHSFLFVEGNYQEVDKGTVRLSFVAAPPIRVLQKTVPDLALLDKPGIERGPGDDAALRTIKATFSGPFPKAPVKPTHPGKRPPTAEPAVAGDDPGDEGSLKGLLLNSRQGILILLLLAACIGAVHALTPGHGKTMVAAYLVGERGTVWHALVLGVVTTLTHTGVVLAIALALGWFFSGRMSEGARQGLQTGLGVVGGLVVACLGFWLLLRRLSGGADHFHIGGHGHHHHGHGHHHHHGHADHYHDAHGHAHPLAVGWWGLVVLGVSGGIVPCWDAIAMLVLAVGMDLLWLAFPLLLAFSAGLAAVLVVIGVLVVYAKGFAGSHWGESRLFRALPVLSAVLVTAVGLWLCYDSVRAYSSAPPPAPREAATR